MLNKLKAELQWRRWKLERWREALCIRAARMVPKPVAYWCVILMAASKNDYPGEQTVDELLKRHESWARFSRV